MPRAADLAPQIADSRAAFALIRRRFVALAADDPFFASGGFGLIESWRGRGGLMNPNAFVGRAKAPSDADVAAPAAGLGATADKLLAEAPRHPEGTGVRLEVSRPRQPPLVRKLARIKLEN